MYPVPGHVAMSLAGIYLARVPLGPAIAATVIVDIVDKILIDVIPISPYGRCWMHTLLAVAICTSIVTYWKGKEWGISWFLGHFLHLIGDIGFVPWFYPFISYEWRDSPNVLAAAIQGVKETISGFQVVRDATGTIRVGAWLYSDAVLKIFKYQLILVELGMFVAIIGVFLLPQKYKPKWVIPLFVIFFLFMVISIGYQFPPLVHFASEVLGDWVLIR